MDRWGPVILGIVISLAASIGLAMVVGVENVFPGAELFIETSENFAGIDRDASTPALPPFERPEDEGQPTRVEILRLLHSHDFDTLNSTLEAKRSRVAQDVRHEIEWSRVMSAFESADPAMTPLLDDWVTGAANPVIARLARGTHRFSLAFQERGTKFANATSPEQFAGMERHLEGARTDVLTVLQHDAKEVLAYELSIFMARTGGTQGECGEIARDGLAAAPASFLIRWALSMCRLPRWGGSNRDIEAVWERAKPFVADNPELKALAGVTAWDEGRMKSGEEAMTLLDRAVSSGPHPVYFLARARERYDQKQWEAALEDATLGLILSPQDPDLLAIQFQAYFTLRRIDDARATFEVFAEVDPTDTMVPKWRANLDELLAYGAAVQGVEEFNTVLRLDQELAQRGDWDGIIAAWSTFLAKQPGHGRAYLERAGAHRQKGDMTSARADIEKACDLANEQACAIAKQQRWR